MITKPVGRPKLYESSSEKLEAFRRRLESAGLMRKEVLVTQETWDLITALAKESGVSVSNAASGLLEEGAKAYAAKRAKVSAKASAKAPPNPIENFLNKRRELVQPAASASVEGENKPR